MQFEQQEREHAGGERKFERNAGAVEYRQVNRQP